MTGSRSDGCFVGVAVAAALAVLVGVTADWRLAAAQGVAEAERSGVGPPLPLGPSPDETREPVGEPHERGASSPAAGASGGAAPGVEAGGLADIEPEAIGLLDESEGGFGPDMWAGTERSLVERLLPALPADAASPAMRGLMRRLLLSSAALPKGETEGGDVFATRVDRLLAMGEVDAVVELLGAARLPREDESVARALVEALLLADDGAAACREVRNRVRAFADPFWRKAFVFCQALAGEPDQAALGAAVLREEGKFRDPAFFALVEVLAGDPDARVESLADPTVLHIAMMRAAQRPFPGDAAGSSRLPVLVAVARSPNEDREARLVAAERAVASGALPGSALAQLYEALPFTPEELAAVAGDGVPLPGPLGWAQLYRAVNSLPLLPDRARLLQKALRLAREGDGYDAVVRANLSTLLAIPPAPELAWFAVDAARALYAAGRTREANAWYTFLREREPQDEQAAAAALEVWPLARIAGAEEGAPLDGERLARWRRARRGEAAGNPGPRAVLLYALLDGLGEPLGRDAWAGLVAGAEHTTVVMPEAPLWFGLRAAAEALRVGEAVLLALLALGEGGPREASPYALNAVILNLRILGLAAESRALALEAAVAGGL